MRYLLLIAIFVIWADVARAEWTVVTVGNRRYVTVGEVADFYKMTRPVSGGESFRMAATGRSIQGKSGTKEILINGVKYVLCFPIESQGGKVLISAMDVVKIIEPIMRPQKIANAGAVKTIILDAGHGGHDSGARGPLGSEKDATLDVVMRAKKLLQDAGYAVRCTRTTDVFVPLENRADFANRHANALFVSVHFNKSNRGAATGVETYCLAPRGVPSMDEENLSYSDFKLHPGHARDAENAALATTVHASMVRTLGMTDRGIKRARFVVIKNISVPGILVEGGFMSGTPDAKLIASPEFRQKLAQCIVDGVNLYKNAVAGGGSTYQKPSAVISAAEPTAPDPAKGAATPAPVGSKTENDRSVVKAQEAIQSATTGN